MRAYQSNSGVSIQAMLSIIDNFKHILREDKLLLRNILKNNDYENSTSYQLIQLFEECKKPLNKLYLYEKDLKNLQIKLRKYINSCRKNLKENQIQKLKENSKSIECLSKAIQKARSKQQEWHSKTRRKDSSQTPVKPENNQIFTTTFGNHQKIIHSYTNRSKDNRSNDKRQMPEKRSESQKKLTTYQKNWTLRLNNTSNSQQQKINKINTKSHKNINYTNPWNLQPSYESKQSKQSIEKNCGMSKKENMVFNSNNMQRNQSQRKTYISQINQQQIIEQVPSHRQIDYEFEMKMNIKSQNEQLEGIKNNCHLKKSSYQTSKLMNDQQFKHFSPVFAKQHHSIKLSSEQIDFANYENLQNYNSISPPKQTKQYNTSNYKSQISHQYKTYIQPKYYDNHFQPNHLEKANLEKERESSFAESCDQRQINGKRQHFSLSKDSYQQSTIKIRAMLEGSRRFIQQYQQQKNNLTSFPSSFSVRKSKDKRYNLYSQQHANYTAFPLSTETKNLTKIAKVTQSLGTTQSILPIHLNFDNGTSNNNFNNPKSPREKISTIDSNNERQQNQNSLFTSAQLLRECRQFLKEKKKYLPQSTRIDLVNVREVKTLGQTQEQPQQFEYSPIILDQVNNSHQKDQKRRFQYNYSRQGDLKNIQDSNNYIVEKTPFLNIHPQTKEEVISYLFKQASQCYLAAEHFRELISHLPLNLRNLLSTAVIGDYVEYLNIPSFLHTLPSQNTLSRDLLSILDLDISHKSYISSSNINIFMQNLVQAEIPNLHQIQTLLWRVFNKANICNINNPILTYWHFYYLEMKQDRDYSELCRILGDFQFEIQLQSLQCRQ